MTGLYFTNAVEPIPGAPAPCPRKHRLWDGVENWPADNIVVQANSAGGANDESAT